MGCGGRCFEWSKLLRSFLRLRLPKRQAREEQAFSSKSFFFQHIFQLHALSRFNLSIPCHPLKSCTWHLHPKEPWRPAKNGCGIESRKTNHFVPSLPPGSIWSGLMSPCLTDVQISLACFGRVHFRSACFLDHLIWNHQHESNTYSMELLQDWWAANTCSCKEIGTKRGTPTPPS